MHCVGQSLPKGRTAHGLEPLLANDYTKLKAHLIALIKGYESLPSSLDSELALMIYLGISCFGLTASKIRGRTDIDDTRPAFLGVCACVAPPQSRKSVTEPQSKLSERAPANRPWSSPPVVAMGAESSFGSGGLKHGQVTVSRLRSAVSRGVRHCGESIDAWFAPN